jgi:hypothetical protein
MVLKAPNLAEQIFGFRDALAVLALPKRDEDARITGVNSGLGGRCIGVT